MTTRYKLKKVAMAALAFAVLGGMMQAEAIASTDDVIAAETGQFLPSANITFRFGPHSREDRFALRLAASNVIRLDSRAIEVPVVSIDFSSRQEPMTAFLGVPLSAIFRKPDYLNATSASKDEESSNHTWLWVGAGVIAVVGVAAIASSGGGGGDNSSAGNSTNCGVSGTIIGPGQPTASGC